MAEHASTQIGALSGGQRRRVFLARALAAGPDLFLLDEPVTGVDATTQEDLMDILEAEARSGKTVVATTHDLGLRRPAVPAGRDGQPDDHRPRPVVADPRPGRARRRRTAATCSSSAGRRSSSTTPITTTTRRPASGTSTRAAAPAAAACSTRAPGALMDLLTRAAGSRVLRPGAHRGVARRDRLRGRRDVRGAQGPGVHRRRGQPRGVPGRRRRLHRPGPDPRRRGDRRGR